MKLIYAVPFLASALALLPPRPEPVNLYQLIINDGDTARATILPWEECEVVMGLNPDEVQCRYGMKAKPCHSTRPGGCPPAEKECACIGLEIPPPMPIPDELNPYQETINNGQTAYASILPYEECEEVMDLDPNEVECTSVQAQSSCVSAPGIVGDCPLPPKACSCYGVPGPEMVFQIEGEVTFTLSMDDSSVSCYDRINSNAMEAQCLDAWPRCMPSFHCRRQCHCIMLGMPGYQ